MIIVSKKEFDQHKLYLLIHKIKQTKDQYLDMGPDEDSPTEDLRYGYRVKDDERIAKMVLGYIYRDSNYDIEKAKKAFLQISSIDIEKYIRDAVKDSASADHWYTYEKEY